MPAISSRTQTHKDYDRLRDWYGGPYKPDDADQRSTRRGRRHRYPPTPLFT